MNKTDNDKLVVITDIAIEKNQLNIPTYRIYDYFKEHPSVFIATASAFIAIISLVLDFAAFINTNSYLMYFSVESIIYRTSAQYLYLVAITVAFVTVMLLFQGFLSKTFDNYLPYKRKLLLYKYYLKKIKKGIKLAREADSVCKDNLIETTDTVSENPKIIQIKEDLAKLRELANKNERDYKSLKKDIRKYRIKHYILIGLSCILVWVVLSIVSALMLSISTCEWDTIIYSAMIFSAVYVIMVAVENWFLSCVLRVKRKKIKSDAELDMKIVPLEYSELPEFPISSVFNGDFKMFMSDSNCKILVAMVMFCLTAVILVFSWSGAESAKTQKEFFVVDIDSQTYVLIYNNGECAMLEKAEISGSNIIIDATQQKMISSIGIDMQKYMFDHVDIVRTKRNDDSDQIGTAENIESTESNVTMDVIGGN